MGKNTFSQKQLYSYMLDKGYSEEFSRLVSSEMNTEFTAGRMLGYLSHYSYLPEGEVVDEMLAILSDRQRIMQKKEMESTQAAWNNIMQTGFEEPSEK